MSSQTSETVISIITAVLNRPEPLSNTIESVLEQGHANIEHIVVDGGSSDSTRTVLENFALRGVRFISEPDDGIYDALNKGLALARGSHICALHASDLYFPRAISTMMEHVRQDPDAIWYADSRIGSRLVRAPEEITPAILLYNLGIAHQSIVAPRGAFDIAAAYDRSFRIVSDYLWMREAYCRGFRFRKMPGCHVHLDEGGLSSGRTEETRQLFEEEVATRTRLHYPFLPHAILSTMYKHRTSDESAKIRAWADRMESSDASKEITLWNEFRAALEDYLERLSKMRRSAGG